MKMNEFNGDFEKAMEKDNEKKRNIDNFVYDENLRLFKCLENYFENTDNERCLVAKLTLISNDKSEIYINFIVIDDFTGFQYFMFENTPLNYEYFVVEKNQYNALKNQYN